MLKFLIGVALGEKLFEESGNPAGFKVTKVQPVEGITMDVSLISEVTDIGRSPSCKKIWVKVL